MMSFFCYRGNNRDMELTIPILLRAVDEAFSREVPHRDVRTQFTTPRRSIPDVERSAQVLSERLLTIGGKCSRLGSVSLLVIQHCVKYPIR